MKSLFLTFLLGVILTLSSTSFTKKPRLYSRSFMYRLNSLDKNYLIKETKKMIDDKNKVIKRINLEAIDKDLMVFKITVYYEKRKGS